VAVLDDRALALRVHENVVAAFCAAGSTMAGGHVDRLPGVAVVGTGLPLLLFNQVLVSDDGTPPDATSSSIRAGAAIFAARGKRFSLTLRGGIDDAYRAVIDELGLVALEESPWMPGMAMHPLAAPGGEPPPAGHEIRRVDGPGGLADHAAVLADGFGMPIEWASAFAIPAMLAVPGVAFYVGYQDGVAVTSGLGVRVGATIGVYNIATVESARRRGLGAAMTQRVVDDGAEAGCDVAILQSSEMGQPIYERLGFRVVSEYFGFTPPRV
jgi:GNAT superfamily N-acetyltransferase